MSVKGADEFANMALITTVESAANTLTFKKLETGISLNEKIAWIINRIEYLISDPFFSNFVQDADSLAFGLSVSGSWATVALTEITILDFNNYNQVVATGVGFMRVVQPVVKDYSSLPSGGIIVPPVPLYGWVKGSGLANATTVTARIWYTMLNLSPDQYWQLVEARRVLSS